MLITIQDTFSDFAWLCAAAQQRHLGRAWQYEFLASNVGRTSKAEAKHEKHKAQSQKIKLENNLKDTFCVSSRSSREVPGTMHHQQASVLITIQAHAIMLIVVIYKAQLVGLLGRGRVVVSRRKVYALAKNMQIIMKNLTLYMQKEQRPRRGIVGVLAVWAMADANLCGRAIKRAKWSANTACAF